MDDEILLHIDNDEPTLKHVQELVKTHPNDYNSRVMVLRDFILNDSASFMWNKGDRKTARLLRCAAYAARNQPWGYWTTVLDHFTGK